jgi:hypothetical protein
VNGAVKFLLFVAAVLGLLSLSLTARDSGDAELRLVGMQPDREVYHSAETMNLVLEVWASRDVTNVTLKGAGIGGRIDVDRQVNLTEGINELHVTHTLPKCNVCGGISAGTYPVTCTLTRGNLSVNGTVEIEIRQ